MEEQRILTAETMGFASLYQYVENYAFQRKLSNLIVALPVVQSMMSHASEETSVEYKETSQVMADFDHALSVCQMLINLHLDMPAEEEDVMLSAALCHILPENIRFEFPEDQLTRFFGLSPKVSELVQIIYREEDLSETEQQRYYERVQQNYLALLIVLADRGNLVRQLYDVSSWSARRYIYETRNYYFPMCIYAKEHYRKYISSFGVLLEKMRCLIEVAEILLTRYEQREMELMQEILSLQEDNAIISGIIRRLQQEEDD